MNSSRAGGRGCFEAADQASIVMAIPAKTNANVETAARVIVRIVYSQVSEC